MVNYGQSLLNYGNKSNDDDLVSEGLQWLQRAMRTTKGTSSELSDKQAENGRKTIEHVTRGRPDLASAALAPNAMRRADAALKEEATEKRARAEAKLAERRERMVRQAKELQERRKAQPASGGGGGGDGGGGGGDEMGMHDESWMNEVELKATSPNKAKGKKGKGKGKKRKGQQRGNERVPAGEEDGGEGVKGEGGDDKGGEKEGEKEDEEENEDTSSGDEDLAMLSLGEDISYCKRDSTLTLVPLILTHHDRDRNRNRNRNCNRNRNRDRNRIHRQPATARA